MKKKISLLALLLSVCVSAYAYDFEVGGIYYNIISSTDKTVEVIYKVSYSSIYSNEYTGSVVIYDGATYSVTSMEIMLLQVFQSWAKYIR